MLWYRVLFAVAVTLLTSSEALAGLVEVPAAIAVSPRRSLRADKRADVDNIASHDDNGGVADDNTEERVIPESLKSLKTFKTIKSLKTLKTIKQTMSQASKTFNEQISPLLSMKARVKIWSKNEKPLDFVKKQLGIEHLSEAAFLAAPNFKYYDDFVTSQRPVWTKKQLTPTEVKAELGLENLADAALTSNPNFKYYDEYLNGQVLVWGKEDLGVDVVLGRLGLSTLAGTARTEAANYKYYEEFVANQIRTWLKDDESVFEVMAKLNLNRLSGEALLSHPNYPFYKYFVKSKLKIWAANWVSYDAVAARLGLENLAGPALKMHPNYIFYEKYLVKGRDYQFDGWLKQRRSTYNLWQQLGLERYHPTVIRRTVQFEAYKEYVNMVDDYVLNLRENGAKVPQNLITTGVSDRELRMKTQIWTSAKRPEEYIKYSLGLKGLEGDALKAAPTYKFFEYYLDARKHIK
ncbi:putative secreted RxLR effector protein [Phytophthora cinnamomi]|uniref:putative secreted RxLR effector protein n=1 Tax=Phytophthora cinnamomi TaxID=4785 RepID=UPI00355A7604|nr:putative secreted RxLR effector protein [Phytophthora cinnamomi]